MDLKEYQARALETALPTALNWDYIATNLLAETHEFAAKIYGAEAKKIRDGKEPDKKNLTAELGDIAWHIAVGLSLENKGEYHGAMYVENPEDKDYMAYELVDTADQCYRFGLTNDRRLQVKYLQYMWRLLTCCAESALGVPLNQVLEANLAKLADRQQRGVIGGSGDNR